ncbi:unnamed protein product [Rotaria magnacalcarata]
MEDDGLRQLIQECISIGARYGNIDVNRVLRGADVTAEHVSTLANKHRCRITKVLTEPIENDAVTFCPDIWSDPIRQISYLCISVAFVDDQYQYRSYDLCCSPFEEEDKSSESIIAVLQKVLKRFGINDLSLNESSKAQNGSSSNSTDDNVKDLTNFDDSLFTIGNIDEISFIDVSKINIKDLPDCARDVIKGLNNCKVKLNGLNKEIQSEGDISLCQSTKVRWLSIIQLLESIDRSFKETKKSPSGKKKPFSIDRLIVKHLIRLLRPFKRVMILIQKGNELSLYMVLICVLTLRETFSSLASLVRFNKENDEDSLKQDNPIDNTIFYMDSYESEGMKFFRLRLLELLETMFVLGPIDFVAAFLHPSYVRRQLKEINERELRKQSLQRHPFEEIIEETGMVQTSQKKRKRFGEEYESGNLSDEYGDSEDEVDKYLAMHIDPKTVVDNPLIFWKENQKNLPLLSKLARTVHSIPASTVAVEREFGSGGLVVTERRSSIHPTNVDNVLFLRSVLG